MAKHPPLNKAQRVARAHVGRQAARVARLPGDPAAVEALDEARRNFKAVSAETYIRRMVDEAPPLTAAQRDRLAAILRTEPPAPGGDPA